ncbi:MAG: WYL domain-containing protein [Nitrospirae bacterium]|nr:WYL domain-containing protein [Nitrospirota bacterium]
MKARYPENIKARRKKDKPSGITERVIRVLGIYTLIAQNKFPSVNSLTDKFEVTKRTVHRDLALINIIDPVEFDRQRGGYRFTHGDRIKKLILSEEQLLLLFTMGETVSHLGAPLRQEFQKFVEDLANIKKIPPDKFPVVVKMPEAIETEKLNDYFSAISHCIREKLSIDIVYNVLYSRRITKRRVDPYGLIFYDGAWLITGYCRLREEMRTFALDRIVELKETAFRFKLGDDFDLKDRLLHCWGIQYNDKPSSVTVRFSEKVAEYVLRKDKWHPSEKRRVLANGDVESSFEVAGTDEIKRWIYSWMPYIEVVRPARLRRQINEELSQTLKKHS